MTDAEWAVFLPRMTRFAELVKAAGLQLVYHHHMGTVIQTEAEIDRFMAGTGPRREAAARHGHAPGPAPTRWRSPAATRDRIGHFHAKDVRMDVKAKSEAGDWSFLDSVLEGVYTQPGDGTVDYVSVFKEIPDYAGWVVIEAEQDPKKAPPKQYVTMGYRNLTRFLRESGLRT